MKVRRFLFLLIVVGLASCIKQSPSLEFKLSKFKVGDLASSLESALSLSRFPSETIPNLPEDESEIIYYLPEGNLHVPTKLTKERQEILSPAPFFIPDKTPVAQRIEASRRAWDEYVRQLTGVK